MQKVIFLDRDGVINQDRPDSVKSIGEFELIPRSAKAIKLLNDLGYKVALITNQSVVGRGIVSEADMDSIHLHMKEMIKEISNGEIDQIFSCYDSPEKATERRKPRPGLLNEACQHYNVSAKNITFIGDAVTDIEAAYHAGCKAVLVMTGKGEIALQDPVIKKFQPFEIAHDLMDVVEKIRDFG